MSLIHACAIEADSPFAYLTALQRHADRMAANPARWLPWNFQDGLAAAMPATS